MRTELTTRFNSALSLSDFTNAVRQANITPNRSGPNSVTTSAKALTTAARLRPVIPPALMAAAVDTLEAALKSKHPIDPMLGPSLSCLVSLVNAVIKRSGPLIEKALVTTLEQAGYVVLKQVAMPVSMAAQNLVAWNEMRALRAISVNADAPATGPMIVYDLLVYCPKTRRAMLLEVKRGNGKTELRKIRPITSALQAGSLQVKAYMKSLGFKVRTVDAKLIDFYGHSGFDDAIRISGDDLDQYFRAPVRLLIDTLLESVRTRLFEALPLLLAKAQAEAMQGIEPAPQTVILAGGIRIAPEHIGSIELPPRRRGKIKRSAKVIAISSPRHLGISAATNA